MTKENNSFARVFFEALRHCGYYNINDTRNPVKNSEDFNRARISQIIPKFLLDFLVSNVPVEEAKTKKESDIKIIYNTCGEFVGYCFINQDKKENGIVTFVNFHQNFDFNAMNVTENLSCLEDMNICVRVINLENFNHRGVVVKEELQDHLKERYGSWKCDYHFFTRTISRKFKHRIGNEVITRAIADSVFRMMRNGALKYDDDIEDIVVDMTPYKRAITLWEDIFEQTIEIDKFMGSILYVCNNDAFFKDKELYSHEFKDSLTQLSCPKKIYFLFPFSIEGIKESVHLKKFIKIAFSHIVNDLKIPKDLFLQKFGFLTLVPKEVYARIGQKDISVSESLINFDELCDRKDESKLFVNEFIYTKDDYDDSDSDHVLCGNPSSNEFLGDLF